MKITWGVYCRASVDLSRDVRNGLVFYTSFYRFIVGALLSNSNIHMRDPFAFASANFGLRSSSSSSFVKFHQVSKRSRSSNSEMGLSFWSKTLYRTKLYLFFFLLEIQSTRHDGISRRDLPPAHSCTVTDVDDLSLSASVISVGRTRWHLAVKNISSADVCADARFLFSLLRERRGKTIVANPCASRSNYAGREV